MVTEKLYLLDISCWSFRKNFLNIYSFSALNFGEGRDEREKIALAIGNALKSIKLPVLVKIILCGYSANPEVVQIVEIDGEKMPNHLEDYGISLSLKVLFYGSEMDIRNSFLDNFKLFCQEKHDLFVARKEKLLEEAEVFNRKATVLKKTTQSF